VEYVGVRGDFDSRVRLRGDEGSAGLEALMLLRQGLGEFGMLEPVGECRRVFLFK
jgi:hypothetical protein